MAGRWMYRINDTLVGMLGGAEGKGQACLPAVGAHASEAAGLSDMRLWLSGDADGEWGDEQPVSAISRCACMRCACARARACVRGWGVRLC
jgi:hypothetical protein